MRCPTGRLICWAADLASSTEDTALLEVPDEVMDARAGINDPELTPLDTTLQDQTNELTQPREPPPPPPETLILEEVYRTDAGGPGSTIDIVLPGRSVSETIRYEVIDGLAVAEGDIILGPASDLSRWQRAAQPEMPGAPGVRRQGLNAVLNEDMLWPNGVIPYQIRNDVSAGAEANFLEAARRVNLRTNLTFVERTSQPDYVRVIPSADPNACSADVGRDTTTAVQFIRTSSNGCRVPTFMHEMLHTAGVWHEQSRPDRDDFVEILEDNIQTSPIDRTGNFDKKTEDEAQGLGAYNYTSVMHYRPFSFGITCTPSPPAGSTMDPDCGCFLDSTGSTFCVARTIRAKDSSVTIQRDESLASDVDDVNTLYPSAEGTQSGHSWGDQNFATAVAVGDVDGDGRAELIVGRSAPTSGRFYVYDDFTTGHELLATGGSTWGDSAITTDVAVGDVDGDGVMEIGVARRSSENNRWFIYRYANGALTELEAGGDDWGSAYYATAIAFGDVDDDGRDEFAVGRRAAESGRYYLFDDGAASQPFRRLEIGGSTWGSSRYTTALAFGDVDNDGRDELGVARNAGSGMRYEIVSYTGSRLEQQHSGGETWGDGAGATSIAFGNLDFDNSNEHVVGRRAGQNSRFYVMDDQHRGFNLIDSGGDSWGSSYYTVGVAMADIDDDKRDELIVARNAGENGRYYVFDRVADEFVPVPVVGAPQLPGFGATDIAAGDMSADGRADIAISYAIDRNGEMRWETIFMNPPAN